MSSAVAVLLGSLFLVASALGYVWLFHPRRYHAPRLVQREAACPELVEPQRIYLNGRGPYPSIHEALADDAAWARLEAVDEAARP